MARYWTLALSAVFALGASAPAFGDERGDEAIQAAESSEAWPDDSGRETLKLALSEAIAMGLENNLNVQIARFAPRIAHEDAVIAWGAYDPETFADFGYTSDKQPNSFAINATAKAENYQTDGGFGLQGLIPYLNATFGLEFSGDRTTTNSTVQGLDPEYNSSVTVSGSIPLLRNLIWNPTWTQVKTSAVIEDSSLQDFRGSVMDVVRDIEVAYWNLVANEEQVRVAEQSLITAEALLDQTQTQYDVGVVSRVEVVESEAGVAEREFNLIVENNNHRRSEDRLLDQILGKNLAAGSTLQIEPTNKPEEYVDYEIDVERAVETAFSKRPELASARKEVERQEIELKFAKNQRLPQFNVEGAYSATGKTGDGNEDVGFGAPPPDRGDFGDSIDDWDSTRGGDTFTIRGVFSIPLGNVQARRRVSRTDFELRRARTRVVRARQQIILEVRDEARNLKTGVLGIKSAERRRAAAAEQLRAERVRLEHGESTPFEVLQREDDFVDSESQVIDAFEFYLTSITRLDRAQGTILDARNIVVNDVIPFR